LRGHRFPFDGGYMSSPEHARGDATDHRADLYSAALGIATVYDDAATRSACAACAAANVIGRLVDPDHLPLPPVAHLPPVAVARVLARSIALNPADRHQTAAALRDDLASSLIDAGMSPSRERLGDTVAAFQMARFPESPPAS